jgi:hypothetical protein
MIAAQKKSQSLEDVLMAITSGDAPPDAAQLRKLISEHPEYKSEIIDFATAWVEMEALSEPNEVAQDDVDLVVNRTMSRVQQILFDSKKAEKLTDLYADVSASGHDLDSFQRELGVDRSILDCLANRHIRPELIPRRLVLAMARVLNRPVDLLREFFVLPPIPAGAYKARGKPEVGKVDFAFIVEHSNLSDAEKRRWLDEEPDGETKG